MRMKYVKTKNKVCFQVLYNKYLDYFYSIYLSNYQFKELEEDINTFIFKELFFTGKVAIFSNLGEAVACPFAASKFNIYNYPTKCKLINLRNAPFIPVCEQIINKDCIVIYAQRNKAPLTDYLKVKINEIVNTELAIKANIRAHKIPVAIISSEESEERMRAINESIDDGEEEIFVNVNDVANFLSLNPGVPYIIDQLYKHKQEVINEVLNYLGIKTNPIEKRERLIVDEIESNRELVDVLSNNVRYNLEKACERAKKYLGLTMSLKDISEETQKHMDEVKGGEDNGNKALPKNEN